MKNLRRKLTTCRPSLPAWQFIVCFLLVVAIGFGARAVYRHHWMSSVLSSRVLIAPVTARVADPPLREIVASFGRNQTITDALSEHGISAEQIYRLVASARPVYNLARVAATRPYWLYLTAAGDLHDFRYPVDDERYLTVYKQDGQYVPVMKPFNLETRIEKVSGVIDDSLFSSVTSLGEQDLIALQLADIFMWDVDFYTDIQRGDQFRLLVEKKYLGGRFHKYGSILAADITIQGHVYTGFRFHDDNGVPGYYGPDGRALKKSFLKSPLKFARISSRFSRSRLHPILKIFRPHLGIDYAAPVGTPVQAVGAGVVIDAGYEGAGGKMVKLRHSGGYDTYYLHLSRIAVKRGTRIEQGQVIGYVGATGLATGPHLDFRIVSHGKFINPTKVIFPPAPPVSKDAFAPFAALRDKLQGQLDQVRLTASGIPPAAEESR